MTASRRLTRISATSRAFPQALDVAGELQNAVVDTPVYDRVLLRSLRRWTGLAGIDAEELEFDDGNGMYMKLSE